MSVSCNSRCVENDKPISIICKELEKETRLTCGMRKYTYTKEKIKKYISRSEEKYFFLKAEASNDGFYGIAINMLTIASVIMSLIALFISVFKMGNCEWFLYVVVIVTVLFCCGILWRVKQWQKELKWRKVIKVALEEIWKEEFVEVHNG